MAWKVEFVPSDNFDYSICIWRRINCQRQSTVLIILARVGSRSFKLISSLWSQLKTRQQCVFVLRMTIWRRRDNTPENGLFSNNSPLSQAPAFISVRIINALTYFMHLTIPRSRLKMISVLMFPSFCWRPNLRFARTSSRCAWETQHDRIIAGLPCASRANFSQQVHRVVGLINPNVSFGCRLATCPSVLSLFWSLKWPRDETHQEWRTKQRRMRLISHLA